MKVKTDCKKCREQIYKEAEEKYLKNEYRFFADAAYSMAIFATVAALQVQHRRNRSRKYIRQFFDDMCFMYDYPEVRGKRLDIMEEKKFFEEVYGIDFSKIVLHLESEKDFVKSVQKAKVNLLDRGEGENDV